MKQKLEELMECCVQYFEQHSFSIPRIDRYKYLWKKKLIPFMADQSILNFDASVGEEYIRSMAVGIITPYERDIIRSIHVLSEFQEKGTISKRHCKPFKLELCGPVGLIMERFILHLESLRRSKHTICGHRLYLKRLLTYLESKEVQIIEDIKETYVITFLSTATNNKIGVISSVRLFLRYLRAPLKTLYFSLILFSVIFSVIFL